MSWSDQHANGLKSLVDNTPLISELSKRRPKVEGKTAEVVFGEAKQQTGYERCIEELIALSEQRTAAQQSSPFIAGLEQFDKKPPSQPEQE